jgi:hypothetical protein
MTYDPLRYFACLPQESGARLGHGQYGNAVASGAPWSINTQEYRMSEAHPALPRYRTDPIQQ